MLALLGDQRALHTFHPYHQVISHSSASKYQLPRRASHSLRVQPHRSVTSSQAHSPEVNDAGLLDATFSATSAASLPVSNSNAMNAPSTSSSVALDFPTSSCQPKSSAPSYLSSHSGAINSSSFASGSSHLIAESPRPIQHPAEPSLQSSTAVGHSNPPTLNSLKPAQGFFSYLKAWRPPVEYYARRRHQHPSLAYPSRCPSLPCLLEECITHDGQMDLVCPELTTSKSLRAYRRKVFSTNIYYPKPTSPNTGSQGWDESDDDLEASESDEDEDMDSDIDCDEALTPTNSPGSTTEYFLQPLILTKPSKY